MKKLLFILMLIPLMALGQKKAIDLSYKFKQGNTLEVKQETVQVVSQNLMGMTQETTNEISGVMKYKVVEVNGKDARIEASFLSLKSKVSSPMANVLMDSEGDQQIRENKVMKSLTGTNFYFTLSSAGLVSNIEDAEKLMEGLDQLGLDAASLAAMKQSLQQQYTGQGLKGSLEGGLVQYSSNKVKPKDKWQNDLAAGMNFPLLTKNTWTLERISGKEAWVNAKGDIITTDKNKTFDLQMGMKGKSDLSGFNEVQGNISLNDGWPIELKMKSQVNGNLTILAGGMLPEDMGIPMEIKTESVFTFTRM